MYRPASIILTAGLILIAAPAPGLAESIAQTVVADPSWTSLLPPIVAIVLALVFKEVVTALFFGVWLGALLHTGFNPILATMRTIDTFITPALVDADHAAIVIFLALELLSIPLYVLAGFASITETFLIFKKLSHLSPFPNSCTKSCNA